MAQLRNGTQPYYSIVQNLITWANLDAREAGKCVQLKITVEEGKR